MRFLINFVLRSVLLIIFQAIGWLMIGKTVVVFAVPWLDTLLVAGILGLTFSVAAVLLVIVVGLIAAGIGISWGGSDGAAGCALVAILLVCAAVGPLAFPLVATVLPGWLTITVGWLGVCVMGWALMLVQVGDGSSNSKSS